MTGASLGPWAAGLLAATFGYVLGSIPFGLLLTRVAGLGDIRAIGSGNIGATNVLRTGKKWLAAVTLLSDAAKGCVPVLIAASFWGDVPSLIAGIAAVVGHNFPVWLNFRGGKGVATTLGVTLGWSWPVGVVFMAVWVGVAVLLRYSSLAALVALVVTPPAMWAIAGSRPALALLGLSVLAFVRHHENIRRLVRGEESRIGGG